MSRTNDLRINPNWIKLHRKFMCFCSYVTSIKHPLNISSSRPAELIDDLTLAWSLTIVITTSIKLFTYSDRGQQPEQGAAVESGESVSPVVDATLPGANRDRAPAPAQRSVWIEFALLNYLPRINQFSTLYYGLLLLMMAVVLGWRIHLRWMGWLAGVRASRSDGRFKFDAKRELLEFYMSGPDGEAPPLQTLLTRSGKSLWNEAADNQAKLSKSFLSSAHTKAGVGEPKAEASFKPETYTVPIRRRDFLRDKSRKRWLFLASRVSAFMLVCFLAAVPINWFALPGIYRVNTEFGPPVDGTSATLGWTPAQARSLMIYGYLEQAYTISQLAVFFVFTNVFNVLMHADLCYKAQPLQADLKLLSKPENVALVRSLSLELIKQHQLRIWAYFDQIAQFDELISKYNVVSLAGISIGIAFAQSFFLVPDERLRRATLAITLSNAMSFSFMYFISESVERQSIPLTRGILAILAAEGRPEAKSEWLRVLRGFFQSNAKRTFSINGKYPANLRTYSRIITALLACCLLIHRLLHRPHWNASFNAPTDSSARIKM